MVKHIGGFFSYDLLRLKVSSDRVFAENFKLLIIFKIAKDIDERMIHGIVIRDFTIRSTTFILDFHNDAVFLSLLHRIGIDVSAKIIDCFRYRSSGKCHLD